MRYPPRLFAVLRLALPGLGFALLLGACQASPLRAADTNPCSQNRQFQLRHLFQLIEERLAVAPLVARSKWNSGAPIDDPVREQKILAEAAQSAAQGGLEPALAVAFFQAQFEAGKLLQRQLHEQWRAQHQPPFTDVLDLGRSVRPVLDRLTPQLIAALSALQPLRRPEADACLLRTATMPQRAVDAEAWATALQPLLAAEARRPD